MGALLGECADCFDLAPKPRVCLRVGVLRMEDLECDGLARFVVNRTPDLSIAARAELVAERPAPEARLVFLPELLTALRALGCDLAQGYHLGIPMPRDAFSALLADPAQASTR